MVLGRKPCGLQGFRLGPPVCGVIVLGETLCPGHSAGVAIAHSQPFPSPWACPHCAPGTVGGHVEVCLVLGSRMPQGRAPGSLGVSPLRCCFLPQVSAGGSAQPSASVGTLPRVSAFTLPSLSGLPGCVGSHLPPLSGLSPLLPVHIRHVTSQGLLWPFSGPSACLAGLSHPGCVCSGWLSLVSLQAETTRA